MRWIWRFCGFGTKKVPQGRIPTVSFDASLVTRKIRSDLKRNIKEIPEFSWRHRRKVYKAALIALRRGRDISALFKAITALGINELSQGRANSITLILINKSHAFIETERMSRSGITHATWLFSGAACLPFSRKPLPEDYAMAAAHQAANGQKYDIKKGLFLNGKWTWPAREDGCRCSYKAFIPGLER